MVAAEYGVVYLNSILIDGMENASTYFLLDVRRSSRGDESWCDQGVQCERFPVEKCCKLGKWDNEEINFVTSFCQCGSNLSPARGGVKAKVILFFAQPEPPINLDYTTRQGTARQCHPPHRSSNTIMTSKRAASSTPTLTHATPRAIPGSASSENLHQHTHTRDRQRRASGTPTSLPRRDSESLSARPTRARVGPLPKNGPGNPLFPPLPPKVVKPRTSSQMKLERMEGVQKIEEDADEDKGDQTVKEEAGEKDPEDWEEYSAKQRKQRGFAGTGGAAAEIEVKDEQQTREEDHETMTSGLSENEAGNESGEEGHVDDAKSTVTVTLEPEQNAVSLRPSLLAHNTDYPSRKHPRPNRNRTTPSPRPLPRNDHFGPAAQSNPAHRQRAPQRTHKTAPSMSIGKLSHPTKTRKIPERKMRNLALMDWPGGRRRDRWTRMGM